MKIGICDDNEKARQMVRNWLATQHAEISEKCLFEFCCGEALLEYLRLNMLDVVFLDCKMDGMNGIDVAIAIRKCNNKVIIIALTNFEGYARFGYGADILDYILKSEFYAKVALVFAKAVQKVKENALKTYAIKTGSGLLHLEIKEIVYIECHLRKKEVVLLCGKTHEFYGRLKDVEQDLKKHGFIRTHNSYLVNSDYVVKFNQDGIWLTCLELPLPVSRSKYKQAYDDMTIFSTEVRQ